MNREQIIRIVTENKSYPSDMISGNTLDELLNMVEEGILYQDNNSGDFKLK